MMGAIFLIIAFVVYFKWFDYALDKRVDYYDVSKIDTLKMTMDKVNNHLSATQVKMNLIQGKYDKDK